MPLRSGNHRTLWHQQKGDRSSRADVDEIVGDADRCGDMIFFLVPLILYVIGSDIDAGARLLSLLSGVPSCVLFSLLLLLH